MEITWPVSRHGDMALSSCSLCQEWTVWRLAFEQLRRSWEFPLATGYLSPTRPSQTHCEFSPSHFISYLQYVCFLWFSALGLAALSTLLILRILFHFLFPRGSGAASKPGSGANINPFVSSLSIAIPSTIPSLSLLSVVHEPCTYHCHP